MKIINIAGILILGFALTSDKKQQIQTPQACVSVFEPEVEIEKEAVVEQEKPTADSFSRPRKPCPPSGPGRK